MQSCRKINCFVLKESPQKKTKTKPFSDLHKKWRQTRMGRPNSVIFSFVINYSFLRCKLIETDISFGYWYWCGIRGVSSNFMNHFRSMRCESLGLMAFNRILTAVYVKHVKRISSKDDVIICINTIKRRRIKRVRLVFDAICVNARQTVYDTLTIQTNQ